VGLQLESVECPGKGKLDGDGKGDGGDDSGGQCHIDEYGFHVWFQSL
jgi:hypothetical protein